MPLKRNKKSTAQKDTANLSFANENEQILGKLLRKKRALESKLLSFLNFFDEIKKTPSENKIDDSKLCQIEIRITALESNLLEEYSEVQLEIENIDPDNFDQSHTDDFEGIYFEKIAEAKQFLISRRQAVVKVQNYNSNVTSSSLQGAQKTSAKLPIIELPKFSGAYEKWLEFRDLYKSLVHDCQYIQNIDKFHYLRSSLEGSAARCIESIDFSAENYTLAWQILCSRFENKGLMVHNYIKALFNIKNIDSNSPAAFRDVVDVLSKNLKCLQAIGINVDCWDPLIIYLVTSKLESHVLKEWEKQKFAGDLPSMKELKTFLSSFADVLEKVKMHKVHDKKSPDHSYQTSNQVNKKSKSFVLKSSSGQRDSKFSCYYCKKNHYIYRCKEFQELPLEAKIQKVLELRLCKNCLQVGHEAKHCKFGHCKHCSEKHNSQLHPDKLQSSNPVAHGSAVEQSSAPIQTGGYCSNSLQGQVLLATALVYIFDEYDERHVVRALLDNASMSNFISENTVDKLNLRPQKVNFSVVGIGHSEASVTQSCMVQIGSHYEDFRLNLQCLVIPEITGNLPGIYFDPGSINIPNYVRLADPHFNEPGPIDLLIGAELFWNLVRNDRINLGKNSPVIQNTRLGWVLSGLVNTPSRAVSYVVTSCHSSRAADIQHQLCKFWEVEEVSSKPLLSSEESLAEEDFIRTHERNSDGRFIVSVPLKESPSVLGDSKQTAMRQFLSLERRFFTNPKLKQMYKDFMNQYKDLAHMSLYEPKEGVPTFYAPHHGVLREESVTTKLRVVFNCSAVSSSGKSYNALQMVGPTVQDDLHSILLRFRQHAYVISADICKMYRQILVQEQFRPLQLIFWRSDPQDPLQTFALNTVTYGTSSAPFLATRCLKQLSDESKDLYPLASQAIHRDFYIDDLCSGAESIAEAVQLGKEVSNILRTGCFELRKWKSNSSEVLEGIKVCSSSTDVLHFIAPEASKILGMVWSCTDDSLSFQIDIPTDVKKVTKRVILSETARVFDPLGLISPIIVVSKILLQHLWSLKLSWDQEVPNELSRKWLQYRSDLKELNSFQVPRHVSVKNAVFIQLHGFSDASKDAYGACIYVRSVDSNQDVQVHLLTAKTRVCPLKSLSVPRLELCAAHLLSQLFDKVRSALTFHFTEYFLWSDSTVVLAWIRASPHTLQVFVGNRVARIQELTNISKWRYVPTESNPADILSRGMSPQMLRNSSLWFRGPDWLYDSISCWPSDISARNTISLNELPETRSKVSCLVQTNQELFPFSRFSSFTRIRRVTAYCLRFGCNCRLPEAHREYGVLSLNEIASSTKILVEMAQKESFLQEIIDLHDSSAVSSKSSILSLSPFLDDRLIRVGGRLKHSSFSYGKKHPILLPRNHHLTLLIFRYEHFRLFHCGPQMLLAQVRETFWPISGRNLAKRVVRQCVVCFRFKPSTPQRIMGQLPAPRVSISPPFLHTGVDYAGPFMIKDRQGRGCKKYKCYLCLFVCLSLKAVHLEIVTSLSTSAFLETFQRFIARRGKPAHMYSDNGSNFVGAHNELQELGQFLITHSRHLASDLEARFCINWSFITAYSPHQGGLWEAGVKSAKHHIRRVLSSQLLTFENFYTIVVQIESILNSRPLTPLSADPNDLEVLTPAHFLIGRSLQAIPYPNVEEIPFNRLSHFQQLEKMKQMFWRRWSMEYVSQLQERTKWKSNKGNLTVGSMVLVRDEKLPSYQWRLGRIIEVHPGIDGIVRVVSIKTSSGVIKRAISKVCPLPVDTQ